MASERREDLAFETVDSPVASRLGRYVVVAGPRGITHVQAARSARLPRPMARRPSGAARDHARSGARALREYFAGRRRNFDDLVLAPDGTPFQQCVWKALHRIPFGTTTRYGALARDLGRPTAARAVGLANGRNPIAIVTPCHRVIGADGTLTGYYGGLHRKRWLLEHESVGEAGRRADS